MGLFINDEELKQLDAIVGELPTRLGIQIISLFQNVRKNRAAEQIAEKAVKAKSEQVAEKNENETDNTNDAPAVSINGSVVIP